MADDTRRLKEEIAELRDRLAEAEGRLERAQRIDSLGRFTASIVHDLGNLLTPLCTATTLLTHAVRPGTTAAALAEEINATAERSAGLVTQILMFLRNEPMCPELLNVNEVLLDMRPLLERLVGSDIAVALALGDVGDTTVDRRQLEHVILNLAANARDAMAGGGKLTIRTACADVEPPEGSAAGKYLALTITDTGAGMAPETLERALKGLFSTKGQHGTGLGLWAAQSFAAAYGGRIKVKSKVGVGTTVVVHLPCLPCPRRAATGPGERAPASPDF